MFRFGILSMYLVAVLDVVVARALYRVFKPVNAALSKLAAWLRIAYAAVFVLAVSQLLGALRLHTQALGHINSFTNIWGVALVLFGLSQFVLAYLTYRSGYVPKLLGVLRLTRGRGPISLAAESVRGAPCDRAAVLDGEGLGTGKRG